MGDQAGRVRSGVGSKGCLVEMLLVGILVATGCGVLHVLAQVPTAVLDQASRATVFIETDRAAGSGFLFSSDGYILTCAHVVAGASRVQVWLVDGRSLAAKIINVADEIDAAILKIDVQGASFLALGSSQGVGYGDAVAAIGFPRRLFTVTTGTISAFPRLGDLQILQITAPINPGNSGGPLVRYSGEVVGIVFASADSGEFFRRYGYIPQALNYAIPIDVVKSRFGLGSAHWRLLVEGQLVFEERFSQPVVSWRILNYPDGLSGIFADTVLGVGYHIIRHSRAGWHWVEIPGISVRNFVLEFDVRSVTVCKGMKERVIVFFRYRYYGGAFDYYLLEIYPLDGSVKLTRVKRDQWYTIAEAKPAVTVKRGCEVNHVMLVVSGTTIIVEVNGGEAVRVTDGLVAEGGGINIGLWTEDVGGYGHIVFTNVRVLRLP